MSVLDGTSILTPSTIGKLTIRKAGQETPKINMLVYGPAGVGKTLLCGSADDVPEMRKVLFLDIEGGTFTLQHKFPNTDILRITNWNQLADVYAELKAGLHSEYNTIVVDSLTEAQIFNMAEIMRQLVEAKPDRSPDVPDIREWGINQTQVKRFIRAFRDLPVTVIMTALMKEDKNKLSGKVSKTPDLPGKLAGQVPALFDEVFYMYMKKLENEDGVKEEKRLLLTGATEDTVGKDRSGKLPLVMIEPTMSKIYNTMMGREA